MSDTSPEKNTTNINEIVPPRPPEIESEPKAEEIPAPEKIPTPTSETSLTPEESSELSSWLKEAVAEGGHPLSALSKEAYQSLSDEDREVYDRAVVDRLKGETVSVTKGGGTSDWKILRYSNYPSRSNSGNKDATILAEQTKDGVYSNDLIASYQINNLEELLSKAPESPEAVEPEPAPAEAPEQVAIEEVPVPESAEKEAEKSEDSLALLAAENRELKNRLTALEERVQHLSKTEDSFFQSARALNNEFADLDDLREQRVDLGEDEKDKGWTVKQTTPAGGGRIVVEKDGELKHVRPEEVKKAAPTEEVPIEMAEEALEAAPEFLAAESKLSPELKKELTEERQAFSVLLRQANHLNPVVARRALTIQRVIEDQLNTAAKSNDQAQYEKIKNDLKSFFIDPVSFLKDSEKLNSYGITT